MTAIEFKSDVTVKLTGVFASDQDVVQMARVSTQGENTPQGEAGGLIDYLMRDHHGSPFEHNYFRFFIEAPIFVWREFMRHRVGFSYNEESGRYKVLEPVFYAPSIDRNLVQVGKPGAYSFEPGSGDQHRTVAIGQGLVAHQAWSAYEAQLDAGIAKEVARMVLPVNLMSRAYVSCNARSLMNFLTLRTTDAGVSHPQHEIELVAHQMEAALAEHMPLTYAAYNKHGRIAP